MELKDFMDLDKLQKIQDDFPMPPGLPPLRSERMANI